MKIKMTSQETGVTSTPWKTATTKNRVYVSVIKNGAVVDAFMSDKDKVAENVERMYGKDATYKI